MIRLPAIEDKYCKCDKCPSYPGCAPDDLLKVFCLRKKAPCQINMRGCSCNSCRVFEMYSLKHEYYCIQGPEKRAF